LRCRSRRRRDQFHSDPGKVIGGSFPGDCDLASDRGPGGVLWLLSEGRISKHQQRDSNRAAGGEHQDSSDSHCSCGQSPKPIKMIPAKTLFHPRLLIRRPKPPDSCAIFLPVCPNCLPASQYCAIALLTVSRTELRRILMKHLAADIRPEFLQFVVQTVIQNQKSKSGGVSGGRAILRSMIGIGDGRGCGIAE